MRLKVRQINRKRKRKNKNQIISQKAQVCRNQAPTIKK